ncbi:SPOR domain-containing protein [Rhodoferax sp. OV413]|uniref:SPOR domain-containing protein n=1 Tax=Rhodoferax sp. OV413 TaxID=1855285 RepID=UPI0025E0C93D|nr:SPOR domain-containing protein [Rhodoferax sp. OV413]
MLRILVLVLLLANAVYFAWSQRYFQMYGFAPAMRTEPQRLQAQIKPENIRLLTEAELEKAQAPSAQSSQPAEPAQPARDCLQAGPLKDKQVAVVRKAMEAALPAGSWDIEATPAKPRWVIYMGRYASDEQMLKKQAELKALGVTGQPAATGELEPGLVLAVLESEAAAKTELARLANKGIRTARVLQGRDAGPVYLLKVPAATESIRAKLAQAKPALAGVPLKACN